MPNDGFRADLDDLTHVAHDDVESLAETDHDLMARTRAQPAKVTMFKPEFPTGQELDNLLALLADVLAQQQGHLSVNLRRTSKALRDIVNAYRSADGASARALSQRAQGV